IRDFHVTGVQTCALPISVPPGLQPRFDGVPGRTDTVLRGVEAHLHKRDALSNRGEHVDLNPDPRLTKCNLDQLPHVLDVVATVRSEERRVGKEWRSSGWP